MRPMARISGPRSSAPVSSAAAACRPVSQAPLPCSANCCCTRRGQSTMLTSDAQKMPRPISEQRATAWSNTVMGAALEGSAMIAVV